MYIFINTVNMVHNDHLMTPVQGYFMLLKIEKGTPKMVVVIKKSVVIF